MGLDDQARTDVLGTEGPCWPFVVPRSEQTAHDRQLSLVNYEDPAYDHAPAAALPGRMIDSVATDSSTLYPHDVDDTTTPVAP
jgi:hypothetical protein